MITLSQQALDMLGQFVSVASTPSNLWRHLSASSTVAAISAGNTLEELEQDLSSTVSREELSEADRTRAYCVLVAMLLKGPVAVVPARSIESLSVLPLAA